MLLSETAYSAAAIASHLLRGPLSRLRCRRSNAAQFLDKATEDAQDITVLPKSHSKVACLPIQSRPDPKLSHKGQLRATVAPVKRQATRTTYPAEGTSHADQASRQPAICRAGRTPAGRQVLQTPMPAGPMPPSWHTSVA